MSKIFLIAEFSTSGGGTLEYFKTVLRFYSSQKYEVVIGLNKKQINEEIISFIRNLGFRFFLIPERKGYFKKAKVPFVVSIIFDLFSVLPIIFKEKPDVVVVSTGNPVNFLGLILLPLKFLYVIHSYPTNGRKISVKGLILNLYLSKNKRILTVSKFSKKNIVKYWVGDRRKDYVHVIYNTLDLTKLVKKEKISIRRKINRVITIGHVRSYKNPMLWIKVAKRVIEKLNNKYVEFIWAGSGELLPKCQKLVKNIKSEKIKFIGYQKDVDLLYSTGTIYFQPSLIESHGLSVIEAMYWRLPCVVTNTGGMPESVVDNETGFVINIEDIDTMVNKIILLLTNKELRVRLGNAGYNRYINNFSYEIWHSKMVKLYNEIE